MKNIRVEHDGAVGILTLDRRERMNALDVEMAQDFRKAGLQLARDESVRAVIIQGTGGVFCSGADLKYIRGGGDREDLSYLSPQARAIPSGFGEVFKQILEYIHSTISEIRRAPKPFIAAVDGVAAAGGLGIAMCCDLVFASDRSVFEWAYGKTALTGAESTTFFLPKLVGLRQALGLALLNPRLGAAAAQRIGLINEVFATAGFEEKVREIAHRLAEGPTRSFAITKALMNQAAGFDRIDFHLDQELENLARIADSEDFSEGIGAFFAKRSPTFRGK